MRLLATAVCAAGLFVAGAACAQPAPLMTVLIRPSAMKAPADGHVDVTITVPAMDVAAGQPLFALPTMAPNMPSAQPRTGLEVRDAEGAVPLVTGDAGDKPWTSSRRVHGEVTARYRLPIDNARGSGPPINLRIDGASFSTPGRMLVAIPQGTKAYRVAIRWDVSAMGPGAIGVSGFGDGDVEIPAGLPERLGRTMFAAGHFNREPEKVGPGFSALWGGEPPFDPRPLLQWTGRLHHWMSGFFKDAVEPPYRVILRSNPQNPGGGVAMTQSFAVGYGEGTTAEGLKRVFGHEMTHTWTAKDGDLGKWFNEGNAVYYQARLPWRAGMITTDEYLADINTTASRYYTNVMKHTPEDQVLAAFWDDTRIRVLPYDRGAMYFAVLDGKVRKTSGGKRSIDDLIRTMVVRIKTDRPVSEEIWLDLLRKEIGEDGLATHRAMMAGGLMLPDSEGFGPCFRRVTKKIRVFDLGFDNRSMLGADKTIQGLKPDSEAAKAGIREGDKVVSGGAGDSVQADVTRTITLKLIRAGQPLSITYLPRGEAVDAWQWVSIPEVPEAHCR